MHAYACIHGHVCACVHVCLSAGVHVCLSACMCESMLECMYECVNVFESACVNVYVSTCVTVYVSTCVNVLFFFNTCVNVCLNTYVNACLHTDQIVTQSASSRTPQTRAQCIARTHPRPRVHPVCSPRHRKDSNSSSLGHLLDVFNQLSIFSLISRVAAENFVFLHIQT